VRVPLTDLRRFLDRWQGDRLCAMTLRIVADPETMALELRPNCEWCDRDLPPASLEARICSYECTFCADCVEDNLHNVCPNCGGGFAPRPIRPATEWRPGLSLAKRPPSRVRVQLSYSRSDIEAHIRRIAAISPADR